MIQVLKESQAKARSRPYRNADPHGTPAGLYNKHDQLATPYPTSSSAGGPRLNWCRTSRHTRYDAQYGQDISRCRTLRLAEPLLLEAVSGLKKTRIHSRFNSNRHS